MRQFLSKLHARVGDLWWYSAMIFIACRFGDAINAFIGLWLVPKYVGPNELGAVLPLQQLTSFLTIPLGVVAIVFAKYVNTYATRGEYGKVKSFIRDVLGISAILFVVCIAGAYLVMPYFYERLRIESGLLTILILASGFVAAIGQLVTSTQQGLKRFKTMSFTAIISAPVRLVTMLVAMPIRALSGYMLGQTTPGVVTTACAAYDTHRALKPYPPDPSWRKDWKEILTYTWPIAVITCFGVLISTTNTTIYRQRLPEIESAAYYMITRFTDIATFLGSSISIVLFPLAAESHEKGHENEGVLRKAILASSISIAMIAALFCFIAKQLFLINSTWATYADFSYLLPYLTVATGMGMIIGNITTYEMACRRFAISYVTICMNLSWLGVLITFTGYEFFTGKIPGSIVTFMRNCNLSSLQNMTIGTLISATLQIAIIYAIFIRRKHNNNTLLKRPHL